jgi:hypothetical protein
MKLLFQQPVAVADLESLMLMSFDYGFEEFVGFTAKMQLIQHYIDTLGAQLIFRDRMSISGTAKSICLVLNSYIAIRTSSLASSILYK